MRSFFTKTYLFWVTSKIIFILIAGMSTLSILSSGRLRTEELAVNLLVLLEVIFLVFTVSQDLRSKSNLNFLKIISGIILIISGITLIVVLAGISQRQKSEFFYLGYPFAVWTTLIGLFEIMRITRNQKKVY